MAWTNPTTQPVGHVVTSAEWNTQVVDNLEHLRVHGGAAVSIATVETTSSTSYVLLTTPDRVQNVVLPTNGLIFIAYQALWKESNISTNSAAIFIGAQQLGVSRAQVGTVDLQSAVIGGTANFYVPLATYGGGLISAAAGTTDAVEATNGQLVGYQASGGRDGGFVTVFANAGTYDISVQYKTSAGTVSAKNRHLWVWVQPFSV